MFCLFVYWQIQINNFYILKFVVSASSLRIFIFFGGTFSPSRGFHRFLPLILPNFKYHSLLLLLIKISKSLCFQIYYAKYKFLKVAKSKTNSISLCKLRPNSPATNRWTFCKMYFPYKTFLFFIRI